jgi:hypothetical protein
MSRIEDWKLIQLEDDIKYYLTGMLYDDERCEDGAILRTSWVKWINFLDEVAQTKNTLYRLGKPAKEETNED